MRLKKGEVGIMKWDTKRTVIDTSESLLLGPNAYPSSSDDRNKPISKPELKQISIYALQMLLANNYNGYHRSKKLAIRVTIEGLPGFQNDTENK
jgi:hypothetical protein